MKISKMSKDEQIEYFTAMIGKKVCKDHNRKTEKQPKPFKSGLKANTVTGIVQHFRIDRPAFTFAEDDSVVACYICSIAPETE